MIKHPALRVRSVSHISTAYLDLIERTLDQIRDGAGLTDLLVDYEITGSYARGTAELHSDLDINLATPSVEIWRAVRQNLKDNSPDTALAMKALGDIGEAFGTRFDVSLQHRSVADTPKMYFSLKRRRLFGSETRRIDILEDGTVKVRDVVQVTPPKLSALIFNDELGDFEPFDPALNDPYLRELTLWRAIYGARLLEYGSTAETSHMVE